MKSLSIIAGCLTLWTGLAAAQANSPSDTMIVTYLLPPTSTCSVTIAEGAGAPEAVGVCGFSPLGIPDGLIFGVFPPTALGLPPASGVVLLEPLGHLPDPGDSPVFWPGTNRIVSDVLVRYNLNPFAFVFVSDGQTAMGAWVALLAGAPPGTVRVIEETGAFQDVTADLGFAVGTPISVRIISDIPEPGTAALLLAGAGIIGWTARRRNRR